MSLGNQLLAAIISSGSRDPLRSLKPELFLASELKAYEFFMNFYRQYGGLPSLQIMAQQGFTLPSTNVPPAFTLDKILNRAIYNEAHSRLPEFQTALQSQNGTTLKTVLSQMVAAMHQHRMGEDEMPLDELGALVMQDYQEAQHRGGDLQGITMGWRGLDVLTSGAQPGEIVTWAARPNIGKSYTLARVATRAWRAGHSVLFVTMEMQAVAMARRLIGVLAGTNPDYIKRGTLSFWGEEHIHETIQAVAAGPRFTVVSGNLSKSVATVDSYVQEFDPDLVVIDAQYLLQPSSKRNNMKQWESLAAVGIEVQQLALTRNKAVHQSVQYGRAQDKGGAKGDLAKIGGTDVVGQISAIVVSILEAEEPHERSRRVLDVTKNRDGSLGSITTNFLFEPLNFDEVPPEEVGGAGGGEPSSPNWQLCLKRLGDGALEHNRPRFAGWRLR